MKKYRKQDWIGPKVEIRPSPIHGRGMFGVVSTEKGEGVAVWGGDFVNRAESVEARLAGKAIQQIDDDVLRSSITKRGEKE